MAGEAPRTVRQQVPPDVRVPRVRLSGGAAPQSDGAGPRDAVRRGILPRPADSQVQQEERALTRGGGGGGGGAGTGGREGEPSHPEQDARAMERWSDGANLLIYSVSWSICAAISSFNVSRFTAS